MELLELGASENKWRISTIVASAFALPGAICFGIYKTMGVIFSLGCPFSLRKKKDVFFGEEWSY